MEADLTTEGVSLWLKRFVKSMGKGVMDDDSGKSSDKDNNDRRKNS